MSATAHRLVHLGPVLAVVPVLAGCYPHSGAPVAARFAANGSALGYIEDHSMVLRVADQRGVRSTGIALVSTHAPFALSADGRWLLAVVDHRSSELRYVTGPLHLYECSSGKHFTTGVPFFVERWGSERRKRDSLAQQAHDLGWIDRRTPVALWFDDQSRVYLGPVHGSYLVWSPLTDGPSWRRAAEDECGSLVRAEEDFFFGHLGNTGIPFDSSRSEFLIVMPYDGWNSKHTVWVRPDSSVLELTRADGAILRGARMLLAAPFVWPYLFQSKSWSPTVEHEAIRLANQKLERAIQTRRAAQAPTQTADQPP